MFFCLGDVQLDDKGNVVKTVEKCEFSTAERSDIFKHCRERNHPCFNIGAAKSDGGKLVRTTPEEMKKAVAEFKEKTDHNHRFVSLPLEEAYKIEEELHIHNPADSENGLAVAVFQVANVAPYVTKDGKEKILFHLVKQN